MNIPSHLFALVKAHPLKPFQVVSTIAALCIPGSIAKDLHTLLYNFIHPNGVGVYSVPVWYHDDVHPLKVFWQKRVDNDFITLLNGELDDDQFIR
jgi:hypothetical protein